MPTIRAAFYVDGFNLYHSLRSSTRSSACRWLNIRALCEGFLSRREELTQVVYFTALATWDQAKVQRHTRLIAALKATGVEIVMGKFKQKERRCVKCRQLYPSVEEKMTTSTLPPDCFVMQSATTSTQPSSCLATPI